MKNLNLIRQSIQYDTDQIEKISVELDPNFNGTLSLKDLIVNKKENEVKIYDRVCDHAGGRLITNNNEEVICTLHKWRFNPEKGTYNSDNVKKNELTFNKKNESTYEVELQNKSIVLPEFKSDKDIEIKFLNHASLMVTTADFKFVTDPWLTGSAFSTGWWLKYKSPDNWVEDLNSCDFLFISHTHPDHLHPETLSFVDKNIEILIADFDSQSTENYLRSLGFNNIIKLKHDESLIDHDKEIYFSVLKSGDFRDDSGLLMKYGKFSSLFNVDSNYLNYFQLPKSLTVVASSFAGGAGAYPVCFDDLNETQKSKGQQTKINSLKVLTSKLIEKTSPDYFMPYAGFFEEKAKRDIYIKDMNKKNTIKDYDAFESKYNLKVLNLTLRNKFLFSGDILIKSELIHDKEIMLNDEQTELVISEFKKENQLLDDTHISQYFKASNFYEDLNLIISLTDDNFNENDKAILVEFSKDEDPKVNFNFYEKDLLKVYESNNKNTLKLKIRKEAFVFAIKNLEPWENITIGFQARFTRFPDVYNSKFWHHFTDIYTKHKAVRLAKECTGCELIVQTFTSKVS